MIYRNCSILDILLLLLLCTPLDTNRVKRLSTPDCDDETHKVEKYVVSIRSKRPQIMFGDNHFCVGTVVAPKFVLTTAKCTMSDRKVMHLTRSMVVVGGTPNRLIEVPDTTIRSVSRIYVPKTFLSENTDNIALLLLVHRWPTNNPSIDIINLPTAEPNYDSVYMVLGWGRFFKGGPLAGNLMHIYVKLIEREKCQEIVPKLQPDMLCAGNESEPVDVHPCAGDNGGPMIVNETIYGLVSYRLGCGQVSMPSVYTDVWYHMDWINDIIQNSCPAKLKLPMLALIMLSVWQTV
ncbi:trypsin-2-like isoform X1 [Drosophila albomicans]|uniref:trypsin n=1 Tax=Drosophila albomicans TaxID=7291 RepID=A0A9C6T5T2_DROAB|nr:trypsin-2-like isoform X1 [Drosophila albomicans]